MENQHSVKSSHEKPQSCALERNEILVKKLARFFSVMGNAPDEPGALWEARSERVVDLNNLRRLGYWSGLAPDGSPLFIRDTSADDIYALDLELP